MINITSMYQQATALELEPYNFGVGIVVGLVIVMVFFMARDIIRNKILKPKKKHDLQGLKSKFEEISKASKVIESNSSELNKIMQELENA